MSERVNILASVCDKCGLVVRDLDVGFNLAVVGYGCACGGKFKKLRGYYEQLVSNHGPFYLLKLPGRKKKVLLRYDEVKYASGAILVGVSKYQKSDLSDLYGFVTFNGYVIHRYTNSFKFYCEEMKKKGYKLLVPLPNENNVEVNWSAYGNSFDGVLVAVFAKEPLANLLESEYSPLEVKLERREL